MERRSEHTSVQARARSIESTLEARLKAQCREDGTPEAKATHKRWCFCRRSGAAPAAQCLQYSSALYSSVLTVLYCTVLYCSEVRPVTSVGVSAGGELEDAPTGGLAVGTMSSVQ